MLLAVHKTMPANASILNVIRSVFISGAVKLTASNVNKHSRTLRQVMFGMSCKSAARLIPHQKHTENERFHACWKKSMKQIAIFSNYFLRFLRQIMHRRRFCRQLCSRGRQAQSDYDTGGLQSCTEVRAWRNYVSAAQKHTGKNPCIWQLRFFMVCCTSDREDGLNNPATIAG